MSSLSVQATNDAPQTPGDPRGRAIERGDLIAAALCILVGVTLSILPHLVWWSRLGEPVWIADEDDLLYLSVAGQAYANHPLSLSDPTRVTGGTTMYPWSQFGPAILLTRGLGLSPLRINLIWRVWAGVSIALGWYLLIRHYVGQPWLAAILTVFLLADIGLLSGRLFLNQFWYTALLVSGRGESIVTGAPVLGNVPILAGIPGVCPQWRIITPGLSLAVLLLHLWLVARARTKLTWPRIVAAGIGFGLLFHTYFYYWTAAGLALVLALLLDAGHRRLYFHTGWIGGLIGLPAIISGFLIKQTYSSDWLVRTDHFVPVGRFGHLLIPKVTIALLVITGLALFWLRRKDLIHLWALAAAGLILTDQQLLTGLEIQNMHWLWYISGPALSLLLVLLAASLASSPGRAHWPRLAVVGLFALVSLHLAIGLALRARESTQNPLCVGIIENYQRYRDQRLHRPEAAALVPNGVMAGDPAFINLAAILDNQRPLIHYATRFSPSTRTPEWYARIALNAYLRGLDRPAFEAEQRRDLASDVWGPWTRSETRRAESLADRLAAYDEVAADPARAIARFSVRYVALPASSSSPPRPEGSWTRIEHGASWDIWEYRARS